MKNKKLLIFVSGVIILFCIEIYLAYKINKLLENYPTITIHDTIYREHSDWELLKVAIIWQESKDIHPNIYQITSIYVKEVNNICGEKAFTIDDTYNKEKSDEMFEIFNGKHNPHKNVDRAIQLHNPKGGYKYYNSVKNYYNLLKYVYKRHI